MHRGIFIHLMTMLFMGVLSAASIEGEYVVKGYNPYEKANYTRVATIRKDKNDVYQMEQTINNLTYTATGLMCCSDKIAFVVKGPTLIKDGEMDIALVVYTIEQDILKGTWVKLKKNLLGTEELTRKPSP